MRGIVLIVFRKFWANRETAHRSSARMRGFHVHRFGVCVLKPHAARDKKGLESRSVVSTIGLFFVSWSAMRCSASSGGSS